MTQHVSLKKIKNNNNKKKNNNNKKKKKKKEGNVLFNDTLNTFYLWLYG